MGCVEDLLVIRVKECRGSVARLSDRMLGHWCVAVTVRARTHKVAWRGGVGGSKGQRGKLIMMWEKVGMALHVSGIVKVFSLNGVVGVVVVGVGGGGGCGRAGSGK